MDTKKIIEYLRQGLWDCFAAAGGDTDGDKTPAALKSDIVALALDCVKDLRKQYDELIDQSAELDRLRAVNAELLAASRFYFDHYCLDEAEDDEGFVCTEKQHLAAKRFGEAIAAAEQSTGEKE